MPSAFEASIGDDEKGFQAIDDHFGSSRKLQPDARNNQSQNCIMIACKNKAALWLQQFLEKVHPDETILDALDSNGKSALHYASQNGCLEAAKLLLESHSDQLKITSHNSHHNLTRVNLRDEKGLVPLHVASTNGHFEVVEYLCCIGANIYAQDQRKRTALHFASLSGHEKTVQLLLEKGANLEAQDKYGKTPLWVASLSGHEKMVQLLLEKGAKL